MILIQGGDWCSRDRDRTNETAARVKMKITEKLEKRAVSCNEIVVFA